MSRASSLLLLLALAAPASHADVFAVDRFDDDVDANPGDGVCAAAGAPGCTLRAAVMEANALDGDDAIQLDEGTYALSLPDNGANDAAGGDLDVTEDLVIDGQGVTTVIDARQAKHRAFDTFDELNLSQLAVVGGKVSSKSEGGGSGGSGGCIRSRAFLGLELVIVSGCSADPDGGGVLQIGGELALIDSTISNNKTKQDGGGVKLAGAVASFERSLIASNKAGDEGGGIAITESTVEMVNTTVSGNSAKNEGGGILNEQGAELELLHVTIADNKAKQGAAIHVNDTLVPPDTTARNSIFQSKKGNNCQQSFATQIESLGGNVDSGTTCLFASANDVDDVDPLLEPLDDNGGPTFTHALDPASPAAGLVFANCEAEDQRGVGRPVPNGIGCDSGAFEVDE
jgi:CSLREA domain-containing protein